MAFEIPFGVKPLNPVPVEYWSGPYSGISPQEAIDTANSGIPLAVRFVSMEANLIVSGVAQKYWYASGTSDSDLVAFSPPSNTTGPASGVAFFDDYGSLSGNNLFIYDGENISLDGTIFSSGERIITSDEIFHIKQLTQAEYDAITPDSATFYIITDASEDAAISGYFEARVDSADSEILANSGYFESRVDSADSDIATVSGLLASVNPTGTPSGVSFFDDAGSLSGNNTFTYDGVDVTLGGNIIASGKRVITSDEIYHIKQLTQAEYDAITPDAATFYIITDPDIEGPVVQPIRTVGADAAILTTDYTIHATAGLNLTLPSAIGNGGIVYNIKNISANTVIVSGVGGETIDGQTSFSLSTQYQSITLQSTNSNWIIL
jgi:hypothetical protein